MRPAGTAAVEEAHQHGAQPSRQQKPASAADQGQQEALREQLPDHPAARGAETEADRDLPLTGGGARQEQVGQVRAGDEQHDAGSSQEQQQRRAVRLAHLGQPGAAFECTKPELLVPRDALGRVLRRER